jgi:phage-related minor tail protein
MGRPAILKVDIIADAKGVHQGVDQAESRFSKLGKTAKTAGKVMGLGLLAAGAVAVKFGKDSVDAFVEAQAAQAKLSDAFARFPKLADVNINSLRDLNSQLALKTKFDDDATASGQAVLAQFGLTGTQLRTLTPLMQDYAAKTGKDLPTAAKDLGKALLGNGKALKTSASTSKTPGRRPAT